MFLTQGCFAGGTQVAIGEVVALAIHRVSLLFHWLVVRLNFLELLIFTKSTLELFWKKIHGANELSMAAAPMHLEGQQPHYFPPLAISFAMVHSRGFSSFRSQQEPSKDCLALWRIYGSR